MPLMVLMAEFNESTSLKLELMKVEGFCAKSTPALQSAIIPDLMEGIAVASKSFCETF